MRRFRFLALLMALLFVATGCGGGGHATKSSAKVAAHAPVTNATVGPVTSPPACPEAATGHGAPGVCSPQARFGLSAPSTRALTPSSPLYPDRSNNDPCYCGASIRAAGQRGLIVKAIQGLGFTDSTEVGMVASARAAGLAVGVYDFDQDYSVAEAARFVQRAQAAGIFPHTPNTFPLYLDVEFGNFSYTGLLAQIAYLHRAGYRVGIYTGDWYWGPHAGCRWPAGTSAWLSGYPNATVPCGTSGYNAHQFTSTPIDLTAYLGTFAQFEAFVQATPPGPTPAQIATRARDTALRAYRAQHCTRPAQGPAACYTLAQRVVAFSTKLPHPHPVCWGKRRQSSAPVCVIVRPEYSIWQHSARISYEDYRNDGCFGPSGQVAQGGPVCAPLLGRGKYFDKKSREIHATWSRA